MRKYHLIALAGVLFIAAGLVTLMSSPVLAQEELTSANPIENPPYLAEYYNAWVASPHADAEAEAFKHWDEEAEVPVECAKCHSTPGYLDYVGADGSDFGTVENPAPLGTVVTCNACHSSAAASLNSVTFPSGVEIADTGETSRCMVCHQGRASGASVDAKIEELGLTEDLNAVSPDLGFINIHYFAAAATLYGGEVGGGYQYEGLRYQMRNQHVPGYNTCVGCHSPHTLEVKVEECATCHEDVESVEDLRFVRMNGSLSDYDGDGDINEGIAEEIEGLQELALEAIQTYAREVAGTPIAYSSAAYPYFFIDANDNGEVDEEEATPDNKYVTFTGNLLKAAYNYQVTQKDPGNFAHNPTYHIELLFDSITMLNAEISEPVDLAFATRSDPGHFDATAEAFRHWDEDGEVPGTCSRCHSAEGLPTYLHNGVNIAVEPSNSLSCSTCHDNVGEFTLYESPEVKFPSGAVLTFGEGEESNLCLNCHQGRESTVSVNAAITKAAVGDDEVSEALTFRNIHYFAAGASLFGGEAMGGYQYEGKEYSGRNLHDEDYDTCIECHDGHELTVKFDDCADCHEEVEEPEDVSLIRAYPEDKEPVDIDGDGDDTEPIADEIESLQVALLAAVYDYAANTVGTAIVYESHNHPYWFIDTNGNGEPDPDEINGDNRYAQWTPTLLRAAYNYQYSVKDPGAFAHNAEYVSQIVYDSLEAIGGEAAVADFTRPPVEAAE